MRDLSPNAGRPMRTDEVLFRLFPLYLTLSGVYLVAGNLKDEN